MVGGNDAKPAGGGATPKFEDRGKKPFRDSKVLNEYQHEFPLRFDNPGWVKRAAIACQTTPQKLKELRPEVIQRRLKEAGFRG
ncbi:hypothetical protein M1271_00295 [Patescibacteria group bacterium]|nr:hypothetical protein [Patescibacteria group bacterium]